MNHGCLCKGDIYDGFHLVSINLWFHGFHICDTIWLAFHLTSAARPQVVDHLEPSEKVPAATMATSVEAEIEDTDCINRDIWIPTDILIYVYRYIYIHIIFTPYILTHNT